MPKLITITGNSGKTVLSYYLGNALTAGGKRVFIISTDENCPTNSVLFPQTKEVAGKSVGEILLNVIINKTLVMENTLILNSNKNLGFLSYCPGKLAVHYPELIGSSVTQLFNTINLLADYIIVDTGSTVNEIDHYAIPNADLNLCITSADLKGLAYRETHSLANVTHLLLCTNSYNPLEDIKHTFTTNLKYVVPFCAPLGAVYNGANIHDITLPKQYEKVLNRLIKETINTQKEKNKENIDE